MQQHKEAHERECSVLFKKQKLFLSARAGEKLDSQVDIYEHGSVMALVNNPEGALHPIKNSSRSTRKDISCQSLYSYLIDKFHIAEGEKLPAWYDEGGMLLFGKQQSGQWADCAFHSAFRRLELPVEQFENCTVFMDHGVLVVSRSAIGRLLDRVTVYEKENVLCLGGDPNGALTVGKHQNATNGIASEKLVAYIRKKFAMKSGRLPARICENRIYFSDELPAKDQDFTQFKPLMFSGTGSPIWVTLMKNGVLRISALAAENLTDWVDVKEWGNVVALIPSGEGHHVMLNRRQQRRGAIISSETLRRRLKEKFGCEDGVRFYAKFCGKALCFSVQPLEDIPLELSSFNRDLMDESTRQFISLTSNGLYFSSELGECPQGRFDFCRYGNLFALIDNANGALFAANNQRVIASGHLAKYLQRELGVTKSIRLFACRISGSIVFSKIAIDAVKLPNLGLFQRVTTEETAAMPLDSKSVGPAYMVRGKAPQVRRSTRIVPVRGGGHAVR